MAGSHFRVYILQSARPLCAEGRTHMHLRSNQMPLSSLAWRKVMAIDDKIGILKKKKKKVTGHNGNMKWNLNTCI